MTPLTPRDYLLYNQMITRIRTLEHIATQHFFGGNSETRGKLVKKINKKVRKAHEKLFPVVDPSPASPSPASFGTAGGGTVIGHGCTFPYCPSGGICELCGFEEIQDQLLAANP
jgi:hypothetical protein